MFLCLWSPLPPLSKLLAIQDHTQNLEEQLWMGGRREVSIISHRPVTRSDLKQERSFFRGSVSTFLQVVVASACRMASCKNDFLCTLYWLTLRPSPPRHTPDIWLEFFALSSLWKQPFFLAPCRCMAMFCKEELLRLIDEMEALMHWLMKWRSYIVLVVTLIQITDKRQKAFGIFPSSGWSTK